MANTVDTEIENAVNRADGWGDTARNYAYKASEGIDQFDFKYKTYRFPQTFANRLKKNYPAPPATVEDTDVLMRELVYGLDMVFQGYFPVSGAYETASSWLMSTLMSGGASIPGAGFDAIWGAAATHTEAQGNDIADLTIPAAAIATPAAISISAAKAFSASKVSADLWQHAASMRLQDVRSEAIAAAGNYIRAMLATEAAPQEGITRYRSAKRDLERAAATWFAADYAMGRRDLTRLHTLDTEARGVESFAVDSAQSYVAQLVESLIQAADSVGRVAQAANSSLNSVVSSSTVGF